MRKPRGFKRKEIHIENEALCWLLCAHSTWASHILRFSVFGEKPSPFTAPTPYALFCLVPTNASSGSFLKLFSFAFPVLDSLCLPLSLPPAFSPSQGAAGWCTASTLSPCIINTYKQDLAPCTACATGLLPNPSCKQILLPTWPVYCFRHRKVAGFNWRFSKWLPLISACKGNLSL